MLKVPILNILLLLALSVLKTPGAPPLVIHDTSGCLGRTEAPVSAVANLTPALLKAARAQRLAVALQRSPGAQLLVPAQTQSDAAGKEATVVFMMPVAPDDRPLEFKLARTHKPQLASLQVIENPDRQYDFLEEGIPVLRYNYRTVEPGEISKQVSDGNRIYARARSDYIHPLFGLDGEELTRDWSVDHPHHRGIYWAWPEVDYGAERGDLHALQRVFARPTGRVRIDSGPVFAQIEAENQWMWEDREPIVRELATIRAYRATARGRFIDLAFQFVALKPGVTVARRGTDKYGGLNIRMATPQDQEISVFTDVAGAKPRRAWADLSGIFAGKRTASGLAVIQHADNPDYPGDWVQYPELSWCQPTFPAPGSRHPLPLGKPVVLRYRLWIHNSGKPSAEAVSIAWEALHASEAARL
jgi:hypothetical protein